MSRPMHDDPSLEKIEQRYNDGDFFAAYDLAASALRDRKGCPEIARMAVLSLANAGAIQRAENAFLDFGLHRIHTLDMLTLAGRLAKDRAFQSTSNKRQAMFQKARAYYESAYYAGRAENSRKTYYPAINVATLTLFSGDPKAAHDRARQLLDEIEPEIPKSKARGREDSYWLLSTALEAYILVGFLQQAFELVEPILQVKNAECTRSTDIADLATTWRQVDRILKILGLDPGPLSRLSAGTLIHYVGHIIAPPGKPGRFTADREMEIASRIAAAFEGKSIRAGYGALAAGADILFAEELTRRNAALHVVLPFEINDYIQASVAPSGPDWVRRFRKLMDQKTSIRFATEDKYLGDDNLFPYSNHLAMGLTLLGARHLHAEVHQLALWDGRPSEQHVGTAADVATWRQLELPQTIVPCLPVRHPGAGPSANAPGNHVRKAGRRTVAMLFADVAGFSKLNDAQLPIFAEEILGRLGKAFNTFSTGIEMINTWGDGVFAVFNDAGIAAECAIAVQDRMSKIDFWALDLPSTMALRIGGHLGPAYCRHDPIVDRPNFYGAHVSRAARMEPIVPKNCVYVTEPFAAMLCLRENHRFACDYVGLTELHKEYGRLRMFLLRRANARAEPATLTDISRVPG